MADDSPFTATLHGHPVLPEYLARFEASQLEPAYRIAGEDFARLRFRPGSEGDDSPLTCENCGTGPDEYHVMGCDREPCPRCLKPAILCHCEPRSGGFATPAEAAART